MTENGGTAPLVTSRELLAGPLEQIPQFRLNELRTHLQSILDFEEQKPPPAITAVWQEPSATEGEEAQEAVAVGEEAGTGWGMAESKAEEETPPPRGKKRSADGLLISPAWKEGACAAAELMLRRKFERAKEGEQQELYLRQLRYSQDSIKGLFQDGRPVAQMRRELHSGEKAVGDIPTIAAIVHQGHVYTVDNRRLWAFKHCGVPHDMRIPVVKGNVAKSGFWKKYTTPSEGRAVRRRTEQGFH